MLIPRGIRDRGVVRPITVRRLRLAHALVLGAALAAMSLGMTAVAHAQTTGDDDNEQLFRRRPRASQDQSGRVHAEELFRHLERTAQQEPGAVGSEEQFRRGERASQDPAGTGTLALATAQVQVAEPSPQPGWHLRALGVLAAALALFGGLTLLAVKHTRTRLRPHQAA
jgi:hypothetical protein